MVRFLAPLLAVFAALIAAPSAAQSYALVSMPVIYVERPVVEQADGALAMPVPHVFAVAPVGLPRWQPPVVAAQRFVTAQRPAFRHRSVDYGPFRVIDSTRIALIGETDASSPALFAQALRDHPGLARLEMVECPGTLDDRANMQLGRMIRAAGLATHVPAEGSVRSGAVELFLAGASQSIEEGAEFAVHSWRDAFGREAADYAADSPENRAYIDYYREMGMDESRARAFYDFTNSVPHARARWLDARDMRPWLAGEARMQRAVARPAAAPAVEQAAPRIAYASLT